MNECRAHRCGRPCAEFLCGACTDELADALDMMPWLLEQLAVTELRQDRISRGLHTGSRPDRPLLFNPDAAERRSDAVNSLTTWARHLCESRGIEYMPLGYQPREFLGPLRAGDRRLPAGFVDTPEGVARWLGEHVTSVRLDEAAGTLHDEITQIVTTGLIVINPPPMLVYRGPCPRIIGRTSDARAIGCMTPLYADRADLFVTCPHCDTLHDVARLEQRLLAAVGHRMFTVPDLVRVLHELGEPVLRGTVAQWIHRGKLRARGRNECGKPLYRLDDVRKLRMSAPKSKGSTA